MAGLSYFEPNGNYKRGKEKETSAKLRGRNQNRKGFDDQSNVDKIYRWIKSGVKAIERPFPAQVKGGTYTHRNP